MKRKMKTSAALLSAAALATTMQTLHPREANATSISTFDVVHPAVIVNAEKIWFPDAQPFMDSNGRTQVPVRQITEQLGATVNWDASTQTVDMQYQGKDIKLQVGSTTATVDGQSVSFDTSAQIVDGRTFVPLRFVTEALGATVKWYQPTQSVYVQTESLDGVKLDPFSDRAIRTDNLPKNAGDFPFILKDLPNDFYEYPKDPPKAMMPSNPSEYTPEATLLKSTLGVQWSRAGLESMYFKAKHFEDLALNVDYRTIDDNWAYAIAQYQGVSNVDGTDQTGLQDAMDYVRYVKAHKVIVKGFAEPEITVFGDNDAGYFLQTHVHFQIINYEKDDNGTGIAFFKNGGLPDVFYCSKLLNSLIYLNGYSFGQVIDTYGYVGMNCRLTDGTLWDPTHFYVTIDGGDTLDQSELLDYYIYSNYYKKYGIW